MHKNLVHASGGSKTTTISMFLRLFPRGMTERAGLLTAVSREGHHARQRAGVELNERRVRSWEFVDDTARRGAARSLHSLARLLTLASVLLCACSVRIGPAQWWRGASRKAKHENSQSESRVPLDIFISESATFQ